MINILLKFKHKLVSRAKEFSRKNQIKKYLRSGREPWSKGYNEYKEQLISQYLASESIMRAFREEKLPAEFGIAIDERIVEYPWAINKISEPACNILDAGSTFNFQHIVELPQLLNKDLTICTYYPESNNYCERRISYLYSDIRKMPFKDNHFSKIFCLSTLEHIDMDNSIYGYDLKHESKRKSFDFLNATNELVRILAPQGNLYISFPYGRFENHGFYQQFDRNMLEKLYDQLEKQGITTKTFFKYDASGWAFKEQDECDDARSFNPHSGQGKYDDMAAHCRCVCCLEFCKWEQPGR